MDAGNRRGGSGVEVLQERFRNPADGKLSQTVDAYFITSICLE